MGVRPLEGRAADDRRVPRTVPGQGRPPGDHLGAHGLETANLAKVRCTLAQVFDSFAIFTVDDGRHRQPGCRRTLCVDFASVHSGDTVVEWL